MSAKVTPRMGLVCFAFGVAKVGPGEQLAGQVLLQLLDDLGLSESAARSLILRMRKEGWMGSERRGREATYSLPPAIYASFSRLDSQLRGQRAEWKGSFNGVLYEVPERSRTYRDRLRRTAQLLGYVTLRPGLLISTTDRWDELLAVLPAPPAGTQLLRAGLTLGEADTRRVARELWGLEEMAKRLEATLAEADERTARAEKRAAAEGFTPREAFVAFAQATLPLYESAADDPDLPHELLPADWPGDRVGLSIGRANRVFGPLIWPYLEELLGERFSLESSRTEEESQSRAPAGAR